MLCFRSNILLIMYTVTCKLLVLKLARATTAAFLMMTGRGCCYIFDDAGFKIRTQVLA